MNKKIVLVLLFILSVSIISNVFADTIILKSGQEVEGKIIEKTDEKVVLDVFGVKVPYFNDEIKSINGGSTKVISSQSSLGLKNPFVPPRSQPQQLQRKGSLVIVGDANLTYASYFFELPSSWVPLMDNMELTHERGFWRGKRANAQVWMQIVPTKKEVGQSIAGLVESAKEDSRRGGGCTGEFLKKYSQFNPSTSYPYEVYFMYDCPKNSYGLIVFLDLPTHFIVFNLYGFGKDENFIISYFDDFNKVINSFKWILGLSDEEIGNLLKNT